MCQLMLELPKDLQIHLKNTVAGLLYFLDVSTNGNITKSFLFGKLTSKTEIAKKTFI